MAEVDSEHHFIASCNTINTERDCLRRSLRIDVQTRLDAASVFGLTVLTSTELDEEQTRHLQQISKLIHAMYEVKLKLIDKSNETDNVDDS